MSWQKDLIDFGKRLISLDSRVTKTEKELEALRRDFQRLYAFTDKVAAVVKRNQDNNAHAHEKLVLELQNHLLQLRVDLMSSQFNQPTHNGSVAPPKALLGTIKSPPE